MSRRQGDFGGGQLGSVVSKLSVTDGPKVREEEVCWWYRCNQDFQLVVFSIHDLNLHEDHQSRNPLILEHPKKN